ncbi:MAG TPA: PEGA domain-containing protein, partial [Kofleriaceae bacterium]
ELAARRRDSGPPKNTTEIERDSAPGLPSPPESGNTGRTGKLLDTSPSPRGEQARNPSPSQPPLDGAKTRLGIEPAKAQTGGRYEPTDRLPSQRMGAVEPTEPSPRRPSSAPIVIGIVFTVAVACAAFWYFVLREHVAEEVANQAGSGSGSALAVGSGSAMLDNGSGSAGSAVAMTGSNGSAAVEAPKGPMVDTEIASNVAKATVTVVDGDQTGPAPFKAKLEKDKTYKIKVEAPGYTATTLDVKGGQDKVTAKLVAKPRIVSVASEPAGGLIYVDGVSTSKRTPADVELSTAQGARKQVHIQVRLAGYRMADHVIDPSTMQDSDDKMTASVDTKLVVAPVVVNTPPHNPTGNGSGAGSASTVTPETGSGAGSATPSNGGTTGTGTGTGTGSATTPPAEKPAGSGSGEPEPSWSKPNP